MCRRPICVAILVLIECVLWRPAWAQSALSTEFFRDRPLYEPLLAEPRPARTMLLVPGWSAEFPDSVKEGSRFAWQISLGDELPILTLSSQQSAGVMEKGRWGVGLWIPVSFHVIEDFKDDSAPIVDTDYRFGFMAKFQCGCFENMRLGLRFVPWAHESTHLGDEYTIEAVKDPAFERVNVSYEYWEYRDLARGWRALQRGGQLDDPFTAGCDRGARTATTRITSWEATCRR